MAVISRDDFGKIDNMDLKLNILFDTIVQQHDEQLSKCLCRADKCTKWQDNFDLELTSLKNTVTRRKWWDKGISGIAGFIGGFIAHLIQPFKM
jgi:hypothetical protein